MATSRARRVIETFGRWQATRSARRHDRAGRPAVAVRHGGRWQPGFRTDPRPAYELARGTLDQILEACRRVDADAVVLPSRDPLRTRVAVSEADRAAVLAELRGTPATTPLLVRDGRERRAIGDVPTARLEGQRVLAIFRTLVLEEGGGAIVGEEHACDLEFHREDDAEGSLVLQPGNQVTERVPRSERQPARIEVLGRSYPTWRPFAGGGWTEAVEFPVDVVYTWVDGSDPAWLERRRPHLERSAERNEQAANPSRYADREELRFSLRSLFLHAEWVNHVWLVTDQQVPAWLDTAHPGITVVDHREIFRDGAALPTFNSHAIESQLHRVPGLTEHFLYLNDDVFLGRWCAPERFFLGNGTPRFFPSRHQLELGPATVEDPPVMAAAKVGRDLLAERFGRVVTQKLKHVPHALRRSLLEEVEQRFPEDLDRTMRSRFRSASDVSLASAFAHHYGYLTGRAVPADLRYRYFELLQPDLPQWLERIRAERHLDVFCLNDTVGEPAELDARWPLVRRFLEAYFPAPSPFER